MHALGNTDGARTHGEDRDRGECADECVYIAAARRARAAQYQAHDITF